VAGGDDATRPRRQGDQSIRLLCHMFERLKLKKKKFWPGVNVITIFCYFCLFSAKKAFFSTSNVMIQFLQKLEVL
jgi:hypothetical protein